MSILNTANSQIYINIPGEDSVISLLNSYLELNFEAIRKADSARYSNRIVRRLVNLDPITLFSNFKITRSSGKHLEDINHAHIVSLMYKLISSSKYTADLSIGFDRDRNRRGDELTNNKNIKGIFHLRNMLKAIFVFAELQEKAGYRFGYKTTLPKIKDEVVLDKAPDIADARVNIHHIQWYVPHYTPSISQQGILSQQTVSTTPTKI